MAAAAFLCARAAAPALLFSRRVLSRRLAGISCAAASSSGQGAGGVEFTGKVGFLGLGIMGTPMASNLIKAGCDVTVWNRTKSKCDPLLSLGAKYANINTPTSLRLEHATICIIKPMQLLKLGEIIYPETGPGKCPTLLLEYGNLNCVLIHISSRVLATVIRSLLPFGKGSVLLKFHSNARTPFGRRPRPLTTMNSVSTATPSKATA